MKAFAETSFLFAFYFPRVGSEQAIQKVETTGEGLVLSSLVWHEFLQAVCFRTWPHSKGEACGGLNIGAKERYAR